MSHEKMGIMFMETSTLCTRNIMGCKTHSNYIIKHINLKIHLHIHVDKVCLNQREP